MEILQYDFFQNAILAWVIIAIWSSLLGNYIVIRREVQIWHTIANASFLWVVVWLILQVSNEISAILFAIVSAIWVYFLEKSKKITSDSIMEYMSQVSIALWIFLLSFLPSLKVDIVSFLFWNILSITQIDIYISLWLLALIIIYFKIFGRVLLWNSISYEISKATQKYTELSNITFLILTSLLIAVAIKIFWILLIWAFLVLPANIWKLAWNSFKQMKYISIFSSILSVLLWLFWSYYFDASPWATIVLILWIWVIIAAIIWKILKK
jgi:zinc transport system permease protein